MSKKVNSSSQFNGSKGSKRSKEMIRLHEIYKEICAHAMKIKELQENGQFGISKLEQGKFITLLRKAARMVDNLSIVKYSGKDLPGNWADIDTTYSINWQKLRYLMLFFNREYNSPLSSEMIDRMTSTALLEYLATSIELNNNLQTTNYKLAHHGYYSYQEINKLDNQDNNVESNKVETDFEHSEKGRRYKSLHRHLDVYYAMRLAQNTQARSEQQFYKKPTDEYSYVDACAIEQISENNSFGSLYNLIFDIRENLTKNNQKEIIKRVIAAYRSYAKLLCELKENVQLDRTYVIKCLSVRKTELTCRWSYYANLAKYVTSNKPIGDMSSRLETYIGRLPPDKDSVSLQNRNSVFLLKYQTFIQWVYENKYDAPSAEVSAVNDLTFIRLIMDNALHIFKMIYPTDKNHIWSDSDFKSAALFLKNVYGIDSFLDSLDFLEFPDIRDWGKKDNSQFKIYELLKDEILTQRELMEPVRKKYREPKTK